jgi:hypothetical protein
VGGRRAFVCIAHGGSRNHASPQEDEMAKGNKKGGSSGSQQTGKKKRKDK